MKPIATKAPQTAAAKSKSGFTRSRIGESTGQGIQDSVERPVAAAEREAPPREEKVAPDEPDEGDVFEEKDDADAG
jgi:hypothetical protein